MVDSTILIDYFRKADKEKSALVKHSINYNSLYISCVTEFEVINGASPEQLSFWNNMLKGFTILDLDSRAARQAAAIVRQLKIKRKSIYKPDLFIAATAMIYGLTFDTANRRHFEHIEGLNLLSIKHNN